MHINRPAYESELNYLVDLLTDAELSLEHNCKKLLEFLLSFGTAMNAKVYWSQFPFFFGWGGVGVVIQRRLHQC